MVYIICKKCFKIIECVPYNRDVLIQHIRDDHPEIELPDDISINTSKIGSSARGPSDCQLPNCDVQMEDTSIKSPNHVKPLYTRRYKINTPITPRSPQKRRMYRTSIEKWRPANGVIYCPKCGVTKKPVIKSRSEKVSNSAVGAACILTCWPLCFLPCIFKPTTREYLHCANCKNFLGMYDKDRNCVRPNREFIDGIEDDKIKNPSQTENEDRESLMRPCGDTKSSAPPSR